MGEDRSEHRRADGRGHAVGRDGSIEIGNGFFANGGVWALIPLAGISIPILAIVADSALAWVVGAIALIAAVTAAARYLFILRHRLRLEELAARERLSLAERDRFAAIDRLVEPELRLPVERRIDEPPRER